MKRMPPSLSKVKGKSNAEREEEQTLHRLHIAINGLPHGSADFDANADAIYLYNTFLWARSLARQKRKDGTASPAAVAKHLKQIASGSARLAKRLADGNVFEAWMDASDDREAAKEEWLQLKSLLATAQERAISAARTAEEVLKAWSQAAKGRKGRPTDEVAETMTIITAVIYERWTGKLASRSISRDTGEVQGQFHAFLAEAFEALGIKSSPNASNARLQETLRKR